MSRDTYTALQHTILALSELIVYILDFLKFKYVLTAKFQTDDLERRFGMYRKMSGCNYHISVVQIMQSERKIRVSSLLKFFSQNHGNIELTDYFTDFAADVSENSSNSECDDDFVTDVLWEFESFEPIPKEEQMTLLYLGGYVAKKVKGKLTCHTCKAVLISSRAELLEVEISEDVFSLFDFRGRGGLTAPSSNLLTIIHLAYMMFAYLLSAGYEKRLLALNNQKKAFVELNSTFWGDYADKKNSSTKAFFWLFKASSMHYSLI